MESPAGLYCRVLTGDPNRFQAADSLPLQERHPYARFFFAPSDSSPDKCITWRSLLPLQITQRFGPVTSPCARYRFARSVMSSTGVWRAPPIQTGAFLYWYSTMLAGAQGDTPEVHQQAGTVPAVGEVHRDFRASVIFCSIRSAM